MNSQNNYIVDYINGSYKMTNGSSYEEIPKYINSHELCIGRVIDNKTIGSFLLNPCVGILHLSSKHIYSTDKHGVIKKDFTPFFNFYPHIRVKTKKVDLAPDICVIINIDSYENGTFVGSVLQYLGEIDTLGTSIINYLSTCHWSKKYNHLSQEIIDITPNRTDMTHYDNIYSIDPIGCTDIDDAIHCKLRDGLIEIGIHIADVSSYIADGTKLDIELSKRCATIYSTEKSINMIPDTLSIDHMSLKQDSIKRAFSMILTCNDKYDMLDIKFIKTLIKVKQNLSYEEAQIMIDKNDNLDLKLIYNVGMGLKLKYFSKSVDPNEQYDTHQMVAIFMILCNSKVAEYIFAYDPNNALLRTHHIDVSNQQIMQDVPLEIKKLCYNVGIERAIYKRGTSTYYNHDSLNLKLYTHFTSPMRRYADIIVHRQLYDALTKKVLLQIPAEIYFRMNVYSKIYKIIEQYSRILFVVDKMSDSIFECQAVIINIDYPHIKVYIGSLDLTYDILICSKKLSHLLQVKYSNNEILINDTLSLKLYQKIKLMISITKKSFKNIIATIIDPDIFSLIP